MAPIIGAVLKCKNCMQHSTGPDITGSPSHLEKPLSNTQAAFIYSMNIYRVDTKCQALSRSWGNSSGPMGKNPCSREAYIQVE